jgi:membrane protease YdiL (CAAX protease family)
MADASSTDPGLAPLVSAAALVVLGMVAGAMLTLAAVVVLIRENVPFFVNPGLTATIIVTAQAGGFALTAVGYLLYHRRGFRYVRLLLPSARAAAVGLLGLVGLLVGVVAVNAMLRTFGLVRGPGHAIVGYSRNQPWVLLRFAALSVFLVAPAEELLFRGVLQTRLADAYGPTFGIVFTSLLFALAHVPAYGTAALLGVVVALFLLGVLFGFLYEVTDNLLAPILVHGVYNAALFMVLYAI